MSAPIAHHATAMSDDGGSQWMRDATFANQQRWLDRLATGLPNPRTPRAQEPRTITAERLGAVGPLTLARTGRSGVIMVTGDDATAPAAIDAALAWLRTKGSGELLIWAREQTPALDIALLARGARDGFVPHWMWRPLGRPVPAFTLPPHLEVRLATPADLEAILANPAIPYVDHDQVRTMLALGQGSDPAIRVVIAREGGFLRKPRVVGMGAVNIADMEGTRTAALFNLGVEPGARGRGIGTALTLAAMHAAQAVGAIGIGLNATPDGERVYRKLGFHSTGRGQTWSMSGARLRHLPEPAMIAFAEALAHGNRADLDPALATTLLMPNGESPVVYAARFAGSGRPTESIAWLLAHGAAPDIVALWTVGMREEARALMDDPRYRDRRAGPQATTPLHEAIDHDDRDLVRALLAAGANRAIRDSQYHGTADDWARALGRQEIEAILAERPS